MTLGRLHDLQGRAATLNGKVVAWDSQTTKFHFPEH